MARSLTFILGGARSGKSRYAEQRAAEQGGRVLYVATAEALDDDMRARIERHRAGRLSDWTTLEVPLAVGDQIGVHQAQSTAPDAVILLDCITLLASNVLLSLPEDSTDDAVIDATFKEVDGLLAAYRSLDAAWLVVSNEVGMGVVPPTHLGRVYRDALGRANQRLAEAADEVILMVAGLPWHFKP